MRLSTIFLITSFTCLVSHAQAQAPAKAPAGSTAQCKDGTFSHDVRRADACVKHRGVKVWFGPAGAAVQTQSPAVTATGAAPTTGEPSRTPATPENPVPASTPDTQRPRR
jgi:hypothetical protein